MISYKTNYDIFIIDNFYEEPESVRNTALNCEYMPVKKDNYKFKFGNAPWPGAVSDKSYSPKNLDSSISKLLGKHIREIKAINSGHFRISKAKDSAANKVHIDGCSYAGVLYLNKIFDVPGTIFYSHKDTGKLSCDEKFFNELILKNEINDLSKWYINLVSYITFNRLIVYPANMFHGIGPLFGTNNENARLIQFFFWEEI